MRPKTRAVRAAAPFCAVPALVLGAVAFAVAGAIFGAVVFVVVAVVFMVAWASLRG